MAIRICVICHEASLTGAPRIGFDIAAHLAAAHDVMLLVKQDGPLIDQPAYDRERLAYRSVGEDEAQRLGYAERVARAVGILNEARPDLVYVNSVAAGEWCEAGARCGATVALHTHETRGSLPGLLSQVCTPRLLQWTDLLIGASRSAMDDLEALTGQRPNDRLEFGIFVNADMVQGQSRLAVEAPVNAAGQALEETDRPLVAMCGLAQPRKGADIFLHAARRLPVCDFAWIGPWAPPETELNDTAWREFQALRLANLYVTGATTNPYGHLRRADAFVLTAREDPNPLVVAEALLLGLKVAAFAETGASAKLLERFGYALSGRPDAARIAKLLPRMLEAGGDWLNDAAGAIRSAVDGAAKLDALQQRLEALVANRAPRAAGEAG